MKTEQLVHLIVSDNEAAAERARTVGRLNLGTLTCAAVLTAAAFVVFAGLRGDMAMALPAILRKESIAIAALLAGGWAFWRLSAPEGRSLGPLALPALLAGLLVFWELSSLGVAGWQARMIGTNNRACLLVVTLLSLPVLGALLALLKWRAPGVGARAGAAAGLAAAGFGAGLYALHCTDDSMLFVVLWYGLAALVLAGTGALAARKLARW